MEQPLRYYTNNLDSTMVLCGEMDRAGIRRLVFSSSATVYRSPATVPVREEAPLWCDSPYGWTKFMNERILSDVAASDPAWSMLLLRYFNPVGAHPTGRIGEDPSGIPNNLVPYITQVAIGRREFLTVNGNDYPTPDGTCIRDYIHVQDLASGMWQPSTIACRIKGSRQSIWEPVPEAVCWRWCRRLNRPTGSVFLTVSGPDGRGRTGKLC